MNKTNLIGACSDHVNKSWSNQRPSSINLLERDEFAINRLKFYVDSSGLVLQDKLSMDDVIKCLYYMHESLTRI